jgi:OmpA-OmpF porin, OOP family
MMAFQMRWVLLAAKAALVGCTSQEQIERQDAISQYPEPCRTQLQQEFLLMANKEAAQNDRLDAKRFLDRSIEAARAVSIYPHEPTAYDIEPQFTDELTSARAQLMTLLDGGKLREPKDLAKAHGALECWLEEAEEGHQDDDLDWSRDRFIETMKGIRRKAGALVATGDGVAEHRNRRVEVTVR